MSDSIQVANVELLEPEMKTVYHFFARASSAIVAASDLGREVVSLKEATSHLAETVATLEENRKGLEDKLEYNIQGWTNAKETISEQSARLAQKDRDIGGLEADNTYLSISLATRTEVCNAIEAQRDTAWANLERVTDERNALAERLKKVMAALGIVEEVITAPLPPKGEELVTYTAQDEAADKDLTIKEWNDRSRIIAEPSPETRAADYSANNPEWHDPQEEPKVVHVGLIDPARMDQYDWSKPKTEGGPDASVGELSPEAKERIVPIW